MSSFYDQFLAPPRSQRYLPLWLSWQNAALIGCSAREQARKALGGFGEDAHRHSAAMLQALQRQQQLVVEAPQAIS